MADNPERREFLSRGTKASGAAIAISTLNIGTAHASQPIDCPIYTFHGVSSGAAVERVIRDNDRVGRISLSVKQLGEILLDERELPDKLPYCLTFDDGLKSQFDNAVPVLNRYGVEATFFVIAGTMDGSWPGDNVHIYMSQGQILYLNALGYEIGSHTVTHRNLVTLFNQRDFGAVEDEIYQSADKLEMVTGQMVTSFCYPSGFGWNNPFIREAVSNRYKISASTIPGRIQSPGAIYALRRVGV